MTTGQTVCLLIGTIAVISLLAFILSDTSKLAKVRGNNKIWVKAVFYGVIGGIFGIYATIGGVRVEELGAIITIRDVGPMMAGCLGGPISGLIAGAIAGIHRLFFNLPSVIGGSMTLTESFLSGTTIPCSISTFIIGLLSGLLFKPFSTKKHRGLWALGIGVVMEFFHLFIVFLYFWGTASAAEGWALVSKIIIPFMVTNGAGFGILIYLLDMARKHQDVQEKEKSVETELNVATNIQNNMLPTIFPTFPGRKEFSIDASMTPAKEIGGDFYDFFFVDDDHFAFLIADVSGKGVTAALFMVISKTILKNNILSDMPLAEAVSKSNLQLCDGNKSNMFVTAWVGVLEISTGKLTYVNAGHNPPLIKHGDKQFSYLKNLSGLVLAGSKKSKYRQFSTYLASGDRLFLYTDGVTEAMNIKNEQYNEKRLLDCISRQDISTSATDIIQIVKADVKEFTGEAEQSDDITIIALAMNGVSKNITVKAEIENFDQVSDFLEEELTKHNIPQKIKLKMSIVLDELFSNVAKYSNGEDFSLDVAFPRNRINLRIEYGGELFDATKLKDPDVTLAAKDRPVGGLGIFIVKKTMTSMTYHSENNKNVLTLYKDLEDETVQK
ncbi:MAG: SpoIIE family protein phosphatase [Bacilli bacterium]